MKLGTLTPPTPRSQGERGAQVPDLTPLSPWERSPSLPGGLRVTKP